LTRATLADVDAALADDAPLPRDNGQLVFEEPWQGRALGLGVATLERLGLTWADFRPYLVMSISRHEAMPGESAADAYYAAFVSALEALLRERRILPE
jgi:nitrile hydratase accessory protein